MVMPYNEAKREFFGGNFIKASKLVEDIDNNALYERLLDNFNIGLIHHTAKNYKLSNAYLEYVADLAENVEPITIQEVAGSLITNEENFYYRLEDYERILIHFFIALNYLALNQPDEAIVEFRRAEKLLNKFSKLRMSKYNIVSGFRFLTAFCYFLRGDYQDAKIELTKIGGLNFLNQFKHPQQLLLIVSSGIAPKKIPNPSFPYLPKYVDTFYEFANYQVKLSNTILKPTFTIDIGGLLKRGLKIRLNSIRIKTLARMILKGTAGISISRDKDWAKALAVAGLFAWEKPDTRSIELLPDKINIYYFANQNSPPLTLQIIGDKKYSKNIELFTKYIFANKIPREIIVLRLPF